MEEEINGSLSFLEVLVTRKNNKLDFRVYRKHRAQSGLSQETHTAQGQPKRPFNSTDTV